MIDVTKRPHIATNSDPDFADVRMQAHDFPAREVDMGRRSGNGLAGRALIGRVVILVFLGLFWGAVAVREWSAVLVIPAVGLALVALLLMAGRRRRE
ncbi:MAG: hypothetical protein R3249_05965 [Nitriliruptorales bacterium]|nr:hypothetical protein [Nitriliruptorales bacterium]